MMDGREAFLEYFDERNLTALIVIQNEFVAEEVMAWHIAACHDTRDGTDVKSPMLVLVPF